MGPLSYTLYTVHTLRVSWLYMYVQICRAGDIPSSYYMTNLTETSREEMERVVVGRGGTCELEFHIHHPRTVLQWEFVSVDYDVSFGWYIRESRKRKMTSSKSLKEVVSSM